MSSDNLEFVRNVRQKILDKKAMLYHYKEENARLKKMNEEIKELSILADKIDDYIVFLKNLQDKISTEYNSFKNRQLVLLEQPVEESLAHIFPEEGFRVQLDCSDLYRKSIVNMTLICSDGRESLVSMGQGKLCQELVSFSSNKAICNLLGLRSLYLDETFAASSPAIATKLSTLLNDAVSEGFQIILVDQHSDIYKDIPRREITIYKDMADKKTIIQSCRDF